MTYSVAWTIENSLRSKTGGISIKLNSISPGANGLYNVSLDVNGNNVDSEWINEYGIWRIRRFGTSASGDKTRIEKKKQAKEDADRLHDDPDVMLSAGLVYPFDLGLAFGAEITLKFGKYSGVGLKGYFRKGYTQVEVGSGFYIPIKMGSVAVTPFVGIGAGLMLIPNTDPEVHLSIIPNFGFSGWGGLCFTTAAVPGLFLQTTYQYNLYWLSMHQHLIYAGIGYAW